MWTSKPPLGSTINWGHPLSNGLVGCWLMNEGGGNVLKNLVKSFSSDMTLYNTFPWYPNSKGLGLSGVTASSSYARATLPTIMGTDKVWSVCINVLNVSGRILSLWDISGNNSIQILSTSTYLNTLVGGDELLDYADMVSGFYSIVLTRYASGVRKMFINGKNVGSFSSGDSSRNINRVSINCRDSGSVDLYGTNLFSSLYFWKGKALSPSEASSLYIEPYQFIQEPSIWMKFKQAVTTNIFGGRSVTIIES